jgi:hypothetical protein
MTRKCIPLYKPLVNENITFWGKIQSYTLIRSLYSSYRHRGNCMMTAIRSGPTTCSSSISTSSIRHFGVEKTLVVLQKQFYWPKLRQDVSKYIKSCTACAIPKLAIKKQGLYTPLHIPEKPWESISMDYMSGLSSTKHGNDCVFIVVDPFSKMGILAAYKKNVTAVDTAKLYFEQF